MCALIVETGAVVANANSYVSVADAAAFHTARGNATWTGTDAVKEAAILRAMDYVEGMPWKGQKTAYANPLQWPRLNVVDRNGQDVPADSVPQGVVYALCAAALVELVTPGALAPALARGGMVKRKKVDVIETEFMDGAPSSTTYPAIMAPLKGLVGAGNVVELVRA